MTNFIKHIRQIMTHKMLMLPNVFRFNKTSFTVPYKPS
jgi:hypothetical protein